MTDIKEMSRAELLEEARGMGYVGITAYSKADLADLVKKERASLARAAAREAKKAEKARAEKAAARAAAKPKPKAKARPEVQTEEAPAPAPAPATEPAQTLAGFESPRFGSGKSPTRHDHVRSVR